MLTEFTSKSAVGSALSRRSLRTHWAVEGDAARTSRPRAARPARGRVGQPGACSTSRAIPAGSPSSSSTELHPDLVTGLAAHPGIGFVVVETERARPGRHQRVGVAGAAATARSRATDPLARYGEQIAVDLLEHSARDHVGDIVVCSLLEDGTDEVAAFEELVGCHGGAGGAQTRAVLLHPADVVRARRSR